ncbi:MAG: hypothetical protein FWF02_05700 [Micrococcales bacterium]|nr:hypothetical protein [Micrococcales bacterium]MCL2667187.1 hypothetical protein [Micrococcales bacterium]
MGMWVAIAIVAVLVLASGGAFGFVKVSEQNQRKKDKAAVTTAVEQYYNAIAAGNAAKALQALKNQPSSTQLLTDKVLGASEPLTNISVTVVSQSGSSAEVEVSYSVNGKTAKPTHKLERTDSKDGPRVWLITDRLPEVDLSAGAGSLPLLLNGQAVPDPSKAELFPGTYTISADTPYVTLTNNIITITDRSMTRIDPVSATLTDEGVSEFRTAVRDSFEECVNAWTIACDCGESVDRVLGSGTEVVEGSVMRVPTVETENWLNTLEPRLNPSDPGQITVPSPSDNIGFIVVATGTTPEGKEVVGTIGPANSEDPRVFHLGSPKAVLDSSGTLTITWP